MCVVSTNDGVGQIEVFNDGLKLSLVVLGDLAAENGGDLAGLADRAVSVQQSLVQLIQCGAPVKDQVVTIFDLGEKEPVLTAASFAFAFFEERSQALKPCCRVAEAFNTISSWYLTTRSK